MRSRTHARPQLVIRASEVTISVAAMMRGPAFSSGGGGPAGMLDMAVVLVVAKGSQAGSKQCARLLDALPCETRAATGARQGAVARFMFALAGCHWAAGRRRREDGCAC